MAYAEKDRRDGTVTGYWYGQVRHNNAPNGCFRRRFETFAQAEEFEAYVQQHGKLPAASGPTFSEVTKEAKEQGGKKGKWLKERDHALFQRLEVVCEFLGDMPIAGITNKDLARFKADLMKSPGGGKHKNKKRSHATVNRYLSAASAVLSFAVDQGIIATVPKVTKLEEGAGREATLSPEEEATVCRLLTEEGYKIDAFLVRVLAATGLRKGELYLLTPAHIADEWIKLRAVDTKANRARLVWIEPKMARELRAIVASNALPDEFMFLRRFQAACKNAGLSEELVIHSLRHTRATRLIKAGVNPLTVMEMLGWTSTSMLRRYSHISEEMQREAAQKVGPVAGLDVGNTVVVDFASEKIAG